MTVTEDPQSSEAPIARRQPNDQSRRLRQACSARRTLAWFEAWATSATTSCSPACCTWRSCDRRVAHADIVSIDKSAAEAHPKVEAVVTGADLAEHGLAWMPTLSNDVQAVLATDKVRFQHQEVAFVVAEDQLLGPRRT